MLINAQIVILHGVTMGCAQDLVGKDRLVDLLMRYARLVGKEEFRKYSMPRSHIHIRWNQFGEITSSKRIGKLRDAERVISGRCSDEVLAAVYILHKRGHF